MKTKTLSQTANIETYTPRILALGLLAVLTLLAVTGCQQETPPAAAREPSGVYNLVSVDGKNVPCNVTHEGVALTVKSGSFTLNADGTCRSLSTFAVPPNPDVHRDVKATYTRQGTELTMRWEGAGMTQGNLDGDTFTMNNEGMIFSYHK